MRSVNSALREQIQSVCDDLYRDPDDADAFSRLRELLGADDNKLVSPHTWRRLVQTASNRLFDEPDSSDARDLLLLLLTAGRGLRR